MYLVRAMGAAGRHELLRGCAPHVRSIVSLSAMFAASTLMMPGHAQAVVSSVVSLSSTPNPVVQGQSTTLVGGVNWTGSASPTGTITISDTVTCSGAKSATKKVLGTITLGSATSSSPGSGTLKLSSFPCSGTNALTGAYSGDANYSPGSRSIQETVLSQFTPTSTSAGSALNPATAGESVTLSATLGYSLASNTRPTGTITFTDTTTGTVLGRGIVQTSGTGSEYTTGASITAASIPPGTQIIQAAYSGDNIYSGSTSKAIDQVIEDATIDSAAALQFIPVTPCRIADTRNATGSFGGPELAANGTRSFAIRNSGCAIPSTALAYSVNVTAVPVGSLGYLRIWPWGTAQPEVSTLNSDGRVKANAAIVPAGVDPGGSVNVFVTDATQVVLDIDGYFVEAGTSGSALQFYKLAPCRVADTRNARGPLGGPYIAGGTTRSFPVGTTCKIPSSATAYSLNYTAVPRKPLGYLTVWPEGEIRPLASVLNAPTGTVVANAAIIPAGSPSGGISVFATDDTDLVIDIDGYFAPPSAGGLSLHRMAPCRVIDTRTSSGAFTGRLVVNVEGSGCKPSSTAQAYVLNGTVVPSGSLPYITLWPDGQSQPLASTLNAFDGAITSNMAIVPTSNGKIDVFAASTTQLILDISAYFAP